MKTLAREVFEAASKLVIGRVAKMPELKLVDDEFIKRWYDSGEKDFGLYSDHRYLLTLLYCWNSTSGKHIMLAQQEGLLHLDGKIALDFHGGFGMSAVLLAKMFPGAVCISHSVVQEHRDLTMELAEACGVDNVVVTDIPCKADLMLAQETFEHIKDPFTELRGLLDVTVKPSQYLDGTSFGIPGPGHFTSSGYLDGTEAIPREAAKRRLTKVLKDRGYQHYSKARNVPKLFNGHPQLFEKL